MQNSKLIEILKTFSSRDLRRFGEFVSSPYFNKRKELSPFYELIRKAAPDFSSEAIDRYKIWAKLYPDLAPEEKQIGYLMSWLLKLLEKFLGVERYSDEPVLPDFYSLDALNSRSLEKAYQLSYKRAKQRLEGSPLRDKSFFFNRFKLAELGAHHFFKSLSRTIDSSIQEAVDNLDYFYLIQKLILTCELINRKKILSASYDIRMVDELLEYIHQYNYDKVPAIALYQQVLRILRDDENDAHFHKLKELLEAHQLLFTPPEQRELYSYIQNYCIRRIKKGHAQYQEGLFQLYQSTLKTGLLLDNGQLSPWKYKNIVSISLKLGKFDWTEAFINDYAHLLIPDLRDSALAYNLANLYYHRSRYDLALRSLMQVEFTDVFYSLDTRKMMLMIYFEQEDTEPMLSLITSFKVYLRRNKLISEKNRQAYSNFVGFVHSLQKGREQGRIEKEYERQRVEAHDLAVEIRGCEVLVEEEWLLNQTERNTEKV